MVIIAGRVTLTAPNGSREVVPTSTPAAVLLAFILAYLVFRVVLLMTALRDVYSDAPKEWVFFLGDQSGDQTRIR